MEQKLIKSVTGEKERSHKPRWLSKRQGRWPWEEQILSAKYEEEYCEEER